MEQQQQPTQPTTEPNSPQQEKEHKVKLPRGQGVEGKRVRERLGPEQCYESKEWNFLKKKFSSGVTQSELRSIAQIVCLKANLKLDREASRDKRVLIKWFGENWNVVEPYVQRIYLHDSEEKIIDEDRENKFFNE
ncbi:hypothetical protein GPJ56_000154 [Histomonas meleagridis]|uniref:uncharacterized protein n=1 Tax=Histomonas meleagridis TaxID=135588 RepID=UPI00355A9524|nr:hypothetical protein GPJ56_000154 [Histomonas meleagridis]KAH0806568.1 hypothetical protein GO595_000730 [Histomonas meleagridis]